MGFSGTPGARLITLISEMTSDNFGSLPRPIRLIDFFANPCVSHGYRLITRAHNLCHDNRQLIVITQPANLIAINRD